MNSLGNGGNSIDRRVKPIKASVLSKEIIHEELPGDDQSAKPASQQQKLSPKPLKDLKKEELS